jgi:hypothetical protein
MEKVVYSYIEPRTYIRRWKAKKHPEYLPTGESRK